MFFLLLYRVRSLPWILQKEHAIAWLKRLDAISIDINKGEIYIAASRFLINKGFASAASFLAA